MEGKSHRIGGTVAMLGTFEYMRVTGALIDDIHPLIQLAVMYPAASFGAQFPDLDHHKGSIPINTPAGEFAHWILHTPNRINNRFNKVPIGTDKEGKTKYKVLNKTVDKYLPLKHRAWQTHSIIFTGGMIGLAWYLVDLWAQYGGANLVEVLICQLIIYGFLVGVASHLFLDILTPKGIWLIPNFRMRLVPKNSFFSTGNTWEVTICRNVMYVISYILIAMIGLNMVGYDITTLLYTYITTNLIG